MFIVILNHGLCGVKRRLLKPHHGEICRSSIAEAPFPLTETQKQHRCHPQKMDEEDAHIHRVTLGKAWQLRKRDRAGVTVLAHKPRSGRWHHLLSVVQDCAAMTPEVIRSLGRDRKAEKG